MRLRKLCGRVAVIFTALGMAVGSFVHVAYSVAGIALILSASERSFDVIKFLGAAVF
ncbi:hypothetical protein HY604_02485 [Candidatus Peregrinibacteria bacterium]|nr:hypothetical protein [Candidatus Peregrinibacteria bacterium]